mgnify:CR=1 FL=1
MMNTMKLPVGIDDFRKLRESDFYYVDKTRLIEQILQSWSEVTLFTRPRRFGKTLNMSMLKSFFEIGTDKSLFDGLYISGNKELCEEYMGKYPVVFLSLKSVEGTSFDEARYRIIELISREAERFKFLKDSEGLSENDKNRYNAIISVNDGKYAMDEKLLISSLQVLSQLLFTHFGRKAIIIVDEYDVPLDKAFQNGYYNEMVSSGEFLEWPLKPMNFCSLQSLRAACAYPRRVFLQVLIILGSCLLQMRGLTSSLVLRTMK